MSAYRDSGQWLADLERAREKYRVTGHQRNGPVRWVEAEAGTGSAYTVVTSRLPFPWAVSALGGDTLVSVVRPRAGVYAAQANGGELHSGYVVEKWMSTGFGSGVHAGDLYAVTVTIALALDREPVIDGYDGAAVTPERMTDLEVCLSAPARELT